MRKTPLLLTLLVLAVVFAFALPPLINNQYRSGIPTPSPDSLVSAAATKGTIAFFTVDYKTGKDSWLHTLCEVSTESGCAFYSLGATKLWERYERNQTVVTPDVSVIEKTKTQSNKSGGKNSQVWKLAINLSAPLPGQTKLQDDAYVLVVEENGVWKFDRFLMTEEVDSLTK
jgi:hypothetical protein